MGMASGIYALKCHNLCPPTSLFPFNPNPLQQHRTSLTFHRQPQPTTLSKIHAISCNDVKVGLHIEVDGNPYKVIKFLHVKPGKGAAFVRTTLHNFLTGNSVEKTFRARDKIEEADVQKDTKQYTYKDGSHYVFMDMNMYEEYRLEEADVGDKWKWLKEGTDCNLLFWNEKVVIDFELPTTVNLKVVGYDHGQGESNVVTLETGAVISVPLFVDIGQEIVVDTRTGQYVSRA